MTPFWIEHGVGVSGDENSLAGLWSTRSKSGWVSSQDTQGKTIWLIAWFKSWKRPSAKAIKIIKQLLRVEPPSCRQIQTTNESVFASSSLLVPDSSRLPRVLYRALSHARLVLHSIFLFPIISSRDSTNFYDMHCLQRPLHVIVSYNMDHYAVSVLVSLDPLVHCSSIRISTWIPVHLSDCPGSRSNIPPIYSFRYH